MTTRLPTDSRNDACDAVVDRVDLGTTNTEGRLRIYSGSQPASAGDAATGTLLAEFTLADPAFGDASNGAASLLGVSLDSTGLADGDAGWARMVDKDEATVVDVSVSASGGGGEVTLNTVTISTGVTVTITAGTITMPAG